MNDREFEAMLQRLIEQDLSAETDAFREALLARCLAVLDTGDEGLELPDDEIELLAAAGNVFQPESEDEAPQNNAGGIPLR